MCVPSTVNTRPTGLKTSPWAVRPTLVQTLPRGMTLWYPGPTEMDASCKTSMALSDCPVTGVSWAGRRTTSGAHARSSRLSGATRRTAALAGRIALPLSCHRTTPIEVGGCKIDGPAATSHPEVRLPDEVAAAQLLAAALQHHAARLEHVTPVGQVQRGRHDLLDEEHGEAFGLVEAAQRVHDLVDEARHDPQARLVEHEEARPRHERTGDG